jgi:hypothetical protein
MSSHSCAHCLPVAEAADASHCIPCRYASVHRVGRGPEGRVARFSAGRTCRIVSSWKGRMTTTDVDRIARRPLLR